MRNIKGDLGLMELPELLQWAEMGQKDGTLLVSHGGALRYFFFQNGLLIYFSSKKEGEQLGEYLVAAGFLSHDQFTGALAQSRKLAIPFVSYLIAEKILTEKSVCLALNSLLKTAITDILQWQEGTFEFREVIPESVLNGPVKLNASQLLLHSAVEHDETAELEPDMTGRFLDDFRRRLESGRIDLPPTPDLMVKLDRLSRDDSISYKKIGKVIIADQILTSRILKVVNSSFYNMAGTVTSLSRAISIIGLTSVKSIATAHALGRMSGAGQEKIRPILRHSLLTAFIARIFAPLLELDSEEVFVCGILHDIGKTILTNYLDKQGTDPSLAEIIIRDFHSLAGYQVARSWKLSAVVQETIRFHHSPEKAGQFGKTTLLVHVADRLAHDREATGKAQAIAALLHIDEEEARRALARIDQLRDATVAMV